MSIVERVKNMDEVRPVSFQPISVNLCAAPCAHFFLPPSPLSHSHHLFAVALFAGALLCVAMEMQVLGPWNI